MVYSLNECKVQTGNSYTTSCQYFLGLPNPQSLSVCHGHCPFFFLSIAFGELYVNFEVTTSLQKSSKWKRSKHCKLSQVHWISSGSRLWAENFGQQLSWDVCHKIELPITWFLLCRHSTALKHHAWLWMLCAISMVIRIFLVWLYSYVQFCIQRYHCTVHTKPKKIAFLERFFPQFESQILEKQEKHSLLKI